MGDECEALNKEVLALGKVADLARSFLASEEAGALEALAKALEAYDAQQTVEPLKRLAKPEKEAWRNNFLPVPHYYNLNHACRVVNDAFGNFGCYLVGSSLNRRDYRDVDIRFIMEDSRYALLFGKRGGWLHPRWSLLCASISEWMAKQSDLPVDFQIQRQSHANEQFPGALRRQPMGLFFYQTDALPERAPEPDAPAHWSGFHVLVELERLQRDYTRACETGEDDTAIQARYRTLASQLADECERLTAENASLRALLAEATPNDA